MSRVPGSEPCSRQWDDPALPATGTAARASFAVALEQRGSWGAHALTQSDLDPVVGSELDRLCAEAGGRPLLIRGSGQHVQEPVGRRVFVAGRLGGRPWLLAGTISDAAALLDLPFDLLGAGSADDVMATCGWLAPHERGVLLVCTNGKRDACCARFGRGLAAAVGDLRPGDAWESTHLGGHRFAPTALVLPTGQSLGRLTPALAIAALDSADQGEYALVALDPRHDRGRCALEPSAQAADSFVRELIGEVSPAALTVEGSPGASEVVVRHRDGRSWGVRVRSAEVPPPRSESCGGPGVASRVWHAALG